MLNSLGYLAFLPGVYAPHHAQGKLQPMYLLLAVTTVPDTPSHRANSTVALLAAPWP